MITAMKEVGKRFEEGEYYVPEMLVAARAMQAGLSLLKPSLSGRGVTTTMQQMQTTIEAIQQAGLRDQVKIIVGGAPVTQDFADQIGADGFSADASSAPALVEFLLQPA